MPDDLLKLRDFAARYTAAWCSRNKESNLIVGIIRADKWQCESARKQDGDWTKPGSGRPRCRIIEKGLIQGAPI
jgi:hypothetical protein